ncbi:hypothetical protein [Chryseobacterium gleum]|uniref:hypothetical protein n=1 Tax=Chryseobacterium gleum TaxID=250 RepID=UPI0028AF946C|nr:hypothetical protein [Chryseobacterium gleum]
METQFTSNEQLEEFIQQKNLINKNSIAHFKALISIKTSKNKISNEEMEILISFENYNSLGRITIMNSELNPLLYPTVFEAKWQKMEYIDDEYLLISDIHKKNPNIGKYTVKIIPLSKLKE